MTKMSLRSKRARTEKCQDCGKRTTHFFTCCDCGKTVCRDHAKKDTGTGDYFCIDHFSGNVALTEASRFGHVECAKLLSMRAR